MMENSAAQNLNRLTEEENKSLSSLAEPEKVSLKDRNHRRDLKSCVDSLKRFFQIITGDEPPKRKDYWDSVTKSVWRTIFEAREMKKQWKASMKLEEYDERARQILKRARDASEEAIIELNRLQSLMEPVQQQLLGEDHAQPGSKVDNSVMEGQGLEVGEMIASLQRQYYAPNFVKSKGDDFPVELENLLATVIYEINSEVQKLSGHPVNLKFSMPFLQPDPNNNRNKIHRMSKKQGHIALMVFFYMHTEIVLKKPWKKAEVLVVEKIKDAEAGEKLNNKLGPPKRALEHVINSAQTTCKEAKKQVNDCKCWFLMGTPRFRGLIYPNCDEQCGVSSELVIPGVDSEALGLDSLPVGSIQNGQCSRTSKQEWNDMVPGDLQTLRNSADFAQILDVTAPLESWEASGCSSEANSHVAPEADGDNECWLVEISKLFPKIKDGGFFDVLLGLAKSVPQRLALRDNNHIVESMDLRVSKLKQKFDNTYQELRALQQNKRKLNQRKKMPTKKGKRPD